jgi:hypothetical protein
MEAREEPISLLPYLQLLWQNRRFLLRAILSAFLASALIVVLIPNRYHAITRLMPPDTQSGSGLGILAAMASKAGTGSGTGLSGFSGGIASDLLGVKSSGALFVGNVSIGIQRLKMPEKTLRSTRTLPKTAKAES